MGEFKGKRFLVTGGCQGMGRGMVVELWRRGADVVTISNNAENLAALKREYPSITVATVDLRDWRKTQQTVDALGVFDGLVNNAGVCNLESFVDCKPEHFDMIISVNTRAVLCVSQVVCKKMIDNKIKGSVVNISSQASMAALKDHVAYCASKSAVDAMTRVMALELGAHGIRVNSVLPTVIMTDLGRRIWSDPGRSAGMLARIPMGRNRLGRNFLLGVWTRAAVVIMTGMGRQIWSDPGTSAGMLARIPMERFGEVCEVVQAALYLLGPGAAMVTGARLPVDGGFLAT